MIDRDVLIGALGPLLADPDHAGVFADFDGTLADIVDVPDAAVPMPTAPALLGRLSDVYGRVGVLSGRPVAFLRPFFSPGVVLSGQYGLEQMEDGEAVSHSSAARWRAAITDAAAAAAATLPPEVRVEDKGLSLTLHFREHPHLEAVVRDVAGALAGDGGLLLRDARRSIELHPPVDADKGTALLELAIGLTAVCFIGDDAGDLPAFDALDDLAQVGVATLRVAVSSAEAPPTLMDRADVVLADGAEVIELLEALLAGGPAPLS